MNRGDGGAKHEGIYHALGAGRRGADGRGRLGLSAQCRERLNRAFQLGTRCPDGGRGRIAQPNALPPVWPLAQRLLGRHHGLRHCGHDQFFGQPLPRALRPDRGPATQPRRPNGGDAQGFGSGCPCPRLYGGGGERRTRTAAGRVGDVQHSLQLRVHRPRPRPASHRELRHPPLRHPGVGKRRQTTANHRTRRARDRQLATQADARAPRPDLLDGGARRAPARQPTRGTRTATGPIGGNRLRGRGFAVPRPRGSGTRKLRRAGHSWPAHAFLPGGGRGHPLLPSSRRCPAVALGPARRQRLRRAVGRVGRGGRRRLCHRHQRHWLAFWPRLYHAGCPLLRRPSSHAQAPGPDDLLPTRALGAL